MLFIDGPTQLTSPEAWHAYLERLAKLNPHDRTVVREKARAQRMLKLLAEECNGDDVSPPPA